MNTRCHVRLRAVGWCYLVVTGIVWLCAVLRDVPMLYLLAATMLGPVLFSWRQARRSMRDLSIERRLPPRTHAGQTVVVELALRNERFASSAWAVGIAETIRGGEDSHPTLGKTDAAAEWKDGARVFFPHVGPGDERVESYLWRPACRGRYTFSAGRLSSSFPLGLFEATRMALPADDILAAPTLGQLKAEWRGWCDRAGREAAGSSQRRGLLEGDYYGLREWRPGDSRRWIHWRSSARQGTLTTLQFEQPRRDELFLVVELWSPANPTAAQREAVERALAFAATVVVDSARRGDRVLRCGLAAAEPRLWLEPLRALERDELLDALAVAEPSAAPELSGARERTLRPWTQNSTRGPKGSIEPTGHQGHTSRVIHVSHINHIRHVGPFSATSPINPIGPVIPDSPEKTAVPMGAGAERLPPPARGPEQGVKPLAGFWAVASTRPANAEALAGMVAAGAPRGPGPLWIDFSSPESQRWFAFAGES